MFLAVSGEPDKGLFDDIKKSYYDDLPPKGKFATGNSCDYYLLLS